MFSIKEGAGLNRLCFCPVCRNPHRDVHGVQKIREELTRVNKCEGDQQKEEEISS